MELENNKLENQVNMLYEDLLNRESELQTLRTQMRFLEKDAIFLRAENDKKAKNLYEQLETINKLQKNVQESEMVKMRLSVFC